MQGGLWQRKFLHIGLTSDYATFELLIERVNEETAVADLVAVLG